MHRAHRHLLATRMHAPGQQIKRALSTQAARPEGSHQRSVTPHVWSIEPDWGGFVSSSVEGRGHVAAADRFDGDEEILPANCLAPAPLGGASLRLDMDHDRPWCAKRLA